jgi:hypothetical protein
VVTGGEGTLKSEGPDLEDQSVTVYTEDGYAHPTLRARRSPTASTVRWLNGFVRSRLTANRSTGGATTS